MIGVQFGDGHGAPHADSESQARTSDRHNLKHGLPARPGIHQTVPGAWRAASHPSKPPIWAGLAAGAARLRHSSESSLLPGITLLESFRAHADSADTSNLWRCSIVALRKVKITV